MKNFIKKSLSIFLMLIMLVPLIGIMTSAEEPAEIENLWNVKAKDLTAEYTQGFDYSKYDIQPGDVITVGPVSINSSVTKVVKTRVKNDNNKYTWYNSSSYKRIAVIDNQWAIYQYVIPDNGSDRVNVYVQSMLRECTLVTLNRPFSSSEYLEYVKENGINISFLNPAEYTGQFINVFPKSDDVFGGRLKVQKVNGVSTVVEEVNESYYTSAPIPVKEGDIISLAGSVLENYYYQVWFFNSANKYCSMSRSNTVRYYYDKAQNIRVDALVVPTGATSMRVIAYEDAYENGNIVVTVNQPMNSASDYQSATKINISGLEKEYTYTGAIIKPAIELKIGGNVLKLGKDYKLTYGSKTVGNKKLTITFMNNYAYLGKVVYSYRIVPKPVDVIWSNTQLVYNGENQAPVGEVVGLIGSDKCNVVVDGAVKCGRYISAVRLSNKNYTLAKNATCEYTISPKPVELVWESTSAVYNGTYQAPVAKVLGIVENDICDVIVSGAGKDVGTYVASAAISNPNYVISENTACSFAIAPKGVILTWSNTELFYTGRPQQPTALIFGLENNDVCNVLISGKGEELGSYTAVATLSNPNYFVAANAICNFTIIKSPIHESVGMPAEFVIDILAIVPDSAEKAAAEAVNNAAAEAVEAASEAAQEVASEIAESVSNSFENIFDNLFSFFKNFGW